MAKQYSGTNLKYRLTCAVFNKMRDPDSLLTNDSDPRTFHYYLNEIWFDPDLQGGQRLKRIGVTYLVEILELENWDIEIAGSRSINFLLLSRHMNTPYYLLERGQKVWIKLFDESVVTQLILYGNDLNSWLDAMDAGSAKPVLRKNR